MKFLKRIWIVIIFIILSTPFTSQADESHSEDEWIAQQFPDVFGGCTPKDFYYDSQKGSSNTSKLEQLGYSAYKVDEFMAYYRVHEKFYGMNAVELAIPAGTDSIYTVTVAVNVDVLQRVIKKKTGHLLRVYKKGFKAQSGVSYLVPVSNKKSTFVCFTFEE